MISLTLGRGESKTLNWKLPKALQAEGVIVGEDKRSVAGVTLHLRPAEQSHMDEGEAVAADAKGAWKTYEGLKPGQYTLVGDDNWEVVSPREITLPQQGALQVLVRRFTSQALDVRAVTPDGQPIPNVALKFSILVPQGGGMSLGNSEAGQTDAQGQYSLSKLRPDYNISVQATREGYKYLRGGAAKYENGAWSASDIVLTPLLGRAQGQVVDAAGQPVQGAQIFSPDAAGSQAASDAQGRFTLGALPEGEITLVATGALGAVAKATRAGEAGLTLKLRPQTRVEEPDRDTAYAILDEVWQTSRGSKWERRATLPAEYAADDLDQGLRLALSAGDDKDKGASMGIYTLISRLLEIDPARAIEWAPAQLSSIKEPYPRLMATVQVAIAASKAKPDLAAQLYSSAQKIEIGDAGNQMYVTALLAALAARLHNGEADALAARALLAARNSNGTGTIAAVAETLAMGSAALAEKAISDKAIAEPRPGVLSEASDNEKVSIYSRSIEKAAPDDPQGALALLDTLEKVPGSQSEFAFGRGARAVVKALGPSDPAGALAVARRVEQSNKPECLALAARFQPKTEALALLREASKAVPSTDWTAASTLGPIAAQAYELDKTTGTELFSSAVTRLQAQMQEDGWRQQEGAREIAVFAFSLSRANPIESRLLLEQEWAFQKSLPPQVRRFSHLDDLAVAMAALDPARAREMAWQAGGYGDDLSSEFEAQMRIARFLLDPKGDASKLFGER